MSFILLALSALLVLASIPVLPGIGALTATAGSA